MRRRTPSEVKAYGDGYAEAYKQFCHLLEKNDKEKAVRKMELFAKAVEITVEIATDEPDNSEKPNNCEHITEDGVTCAKYPACDDCLDNPLNKVKGSERLLKGSEKPNNCEPKICDTCRYYNSNIPCGSTPSACKEADKFAEEFVDGLKKLKPKVEPTISKMEQVDDETQTQLTARCLNCNNAKACKEKHWEGCVYEPKDEKTCETCRHWKYIAHEWQCEACKCQGYEPKDEPKTQMKTQNSNLTFEKWEAPPKFEHKGDTTTCVSVPACLLEIEDEPQTDCAWK